MRPLRTDLTIAASLIALVVSDPATSQEFDSRPLATPIAYPGSDFFPATWPEFRDWLQTLDASGANLGEEDRLFLREQLYSHVSADAKRRFHADELLLPQRDAELASMFTWADRHGAIGAALVASVLSDTAVPGTTPVPAGFRIDFDSAFTLTAERDGWRIAFPHYFMISLLVEQTLANGIDATLAMLSTLFAADSTDAGASQATILIASSQSRPADMTAFWLGRAGLTPADTASSPVEGAIGAYVGRDPSNTMTVEVVVFTPTDQSVILFMYAGLDGTFEANRPHFIDLMNSLRVRGEVE